MARGLPYCDVARFLARESSGTPPIHYALEAPAGLGPFATVDCTPAGGTMIANDLICAVPLPAGFSGHALLAVEFSDGFTTDRYAYRTFVPRLAAP